MHLLQRMACGLVVAMIVGCGVSRTTSAASTFKMIGGQKASEASFMLGIIEGSGHRPFCGASLLAPGVALTSAHCVKNRSKALWVVGASDLEKGVNASLRHRVKTVEVHPNYDIDARRADLAVLTFDTKNIASAEWQPVSLDDSGAVYQSASVMGWGVRSNYGDLPSDETLVAEFPLIEISKCKALGSDYDQLDDTMICAGHLGYGQADTCHGDSGGPLYVNGADGKPRLLGVVSWGHDCSEADKPGIYTKVGSYRSWIESTMKAPTDGEIIASGEVMAHEVMRHCRDELQQKAIDWNGDHQLSLTGNLNAIAPFAKTDERPAANDSPTCNWTTSNGHTFWIYHNAMASDHLEHQKVLVKDAASGDFYLSTTDSSVRAELLCNADPVQKAEPILTMSDESLTVRFGGTLYRWGGNIPHRLMAHPVQPRVGPPLPPSQGCTVLDYSLMIIGHESELPSAGIIVRVSAPFLGAGEHEFVLPKYETPKAAEITFAKADGRHGVIELRNSTGRDIFGWQLECDKPLALDIEGANPGPDKSGLGPQKIHDFGLGSSVWHKFDKDQTFTTSYRTDEDFPLGQKVTCWINHIPLKVNER